MSEVPPRIEPIWGIVRALVGESYDCPFRQIEFTSGLAPMASIRKIAATGVISFLSIIALQQKLPTTRGDSWITSSYLPDYAGRE